MIPRTGNSPMHVFGLFILMCSIATSSAAAETVLKTQRFVLVPTNATAIVQFQVPGPGKVILEATAPYQLNRLGLIARGADPNSADLRKDGPTPLRMEFTVTAQNLAKGSTWTVYPTIRGADGTVYAIPGSAAIGDLKVSFVSNVPVPMQKTALRRMDMPKGSAPAPGQPAAPAQIQPAAPPKGMQRNSSMPAASVPAGTAVNPTATFTPKVSQPPRLAATPAGLMTPSATIVGQSVPQPPGSKTQKPIYRNPSGFTATAGAGGDVILTWNLVPNAISYNLQGPGVKPDPVTGMPPNVSGTTYVIKGLPVGAHSWALYAVFSGPSGPFYGDESKPSKTSISPPILIGTGISDITGPIAEVGMMGYANISQSASGLHTRLYARAFVFANPNSSRRVVMVTAELGQVFSSLKQGVIRRLRQIYGSKYDDGNVMISATHTHAGPGGYSHHAIFNITSFGFVQQNYDAIVEGITRAIVQADGNVAAATLRVATGYMVVPSAMRAAIGNIPGSVNRSPDAHKLNRDLKPGMADVNREMLVLRVDRPATGPAGVIAWFPVHNTSLSKDNLLVGSDHKGYAAYLFEKNKGTIMPLRQPGKFVAAFPNGDEGDVSPNIWPNFTRGGGEFGAMYTIGQLEFENANSLFNDANENVTGPLEYRHMFVRMSGLDVPGATLPNGANEKKLCRAAYGFSFGGGAEDGPSGFEDLYEGMKITQKSPEDWERLRNNFSVRTLIPAALIAVAIEFNDPCQHPKPVLIPSGAWQWTPDILPFQLLRVGTLAIAAVPGEMTTQAGRRLREHILTILRPQGVTRAVITGLANEYSGYVSTLEEYAAQHYEGASTLYGPLTLDAYLQVFGQLANAMVVNQTVPAGPTPLDLSANQISLQTPVYVDNKRLVEQFGQVFQQPPAAVPLGGSVEVRFRAGHPKNDLRTNNTYLVVERYTGPNNWEAVAWDSMPETRLTWRRETGTDCIGGCSFADVRWDVPPDAVAGTYRIRHFGAWKNGWNGAISQYTGVTNHFQVGMPAAGSTPPPPQQTHSVASCGGAGQRACCVTERIPSCDQGLIEFKGCTTGDCTCGGANPYSVLKSIGHCVASQ